LEVSKTAQQNIIIYTLWETPVGIVPGYAPYRQEIGVRLPAEERDVLFSTEPRTVLRSIPISYPMPPEVKRPERAVEPLTSI
jgi:hypothetical protein